MNPAEPSNTTLAPNYLRVLPRLLIGLTILGFGLLWTLDNLDILDSEQFTQWWPVVIIIIGVLRLFDPRANKFATVLIFILGIGILMDTLDYRDFDLGNFIPLVAVVIGFKLIKDVFSRKQARPVSTDDPDSMVHAFALMAGVERKGVSDDFKGGSLNAIMGGVELDLRNAQIKQGTEAVFDCFAMWGGVVVRVPESWRVVSQVFPLMGAFEDNTSGGTPGGPVLIMRGMALMGGIEVKN
jgi:Domain of unknown function (DUF5668)